MTVHTGYEWMEIGIKKAQEQNRKTIEMEEVIEFGKAMKQYQIVLRKLEAMRNKIERAMRSEEYQQARRAKREKKLATEQRKRARSEARDKKKAEKRERKAQKKAAKQPILEAPVETYEESQEPEPEEIGGEMEE